MYQCKSQCLPLRFLGMQKWYMILRKELIEEKVESDTKTERYHITLQIENKVETKTEDSPQREKLSPRRSPYRRICPKSIP